MFTHVNVYERVDGGGLNLLPSLMVCGCKIACTEISCGRLIICYTRIRSRTYEHTHAHIYDMVEIINYWLRQICYRIYGKRARPLAVGGDDEYWVRYTTTLCAKDAECALNKGVFL